MILWESIIAERQRPLNTLRIEDAAERNARYQKLKYDRKYDSTPERKAQHKRYAQSEAGRRSDRERSRRYREAHPDRVKAKRDRFYSKMMADPEMRERYYAKSKRWRDAHKDDPEYKARLKVSRANEKRVFVERHGYSRNWWFNVRRRLRPFGGEHTLWLMGGVVKVNMGRAA